MVSASLGWTTSGVTLGSDGILIVDVAATTRRLTEVGPGGVLAPHASLLEKRLDSDEPRIFDAKYLYPTRDGGYLLNDDAGSRDGSVYFLDQDHRIRANIQVENRTLGDEQLLAVFRMAPMGDTGILAFADFETWSTFIYLDTDGAFEIFSKLETVDGARGVPDHVRELYLRDFSYITSIGDTGFVLIMDEVPWVGKVVRGSSTVSRMAELPESFNSSPKLLRDPRWLGRSEMTNRQLLQWYRTIEDSAMPTGVFARDGRLYVTTKEALAEDGTTTWWILGIDAESGQEVSRFRAPTRAHHINFIAGETLGMIEKGPIELVGGFPGEALFRETSSMVLFPSGWLDEGDGHMTKEGATCIPWQ
jgi:hypothetical protein